MQGIQQRMLGAQCAESNLHGGKMSSMRDPSGCSVQPPPRAYPHLFMAVPGARASYVPYGRGVLSGQA